MSNEIGVNHYNGSYIQKGIEVKEPRPLNELSIFDLNRIEKALEENLEKGNISQEVFQRELDKLDIVKAGKLSQNGKLKPVHIIDKNGHHRVVWKLPEEISGMKNEGHKKVRQVGKGDKVTYNGETHEVHSISDKHGYWTLIGPDGKKHDKSPARLQAVHAPEESSEPKKTEEPKKEETTQNYKVGQKVNIDDFGVNREYTIKKISPNGEMSLEAPGTATFTADKKWLDENKIEPKKEASKSDAKKEEPKADERVVEEQPKHDPRIRGNMKSMIAAYGGADKVKQDFPDSSKYFERLADVEEYKQKIKNENASAYKSAGVLKMYREYLSKYKGYLEKEEKKLSEQLIESLGLGEIPFLGIEKPGEIKNNTGISIQSLAGVVQKNPYEKEYADGEWKKSEPNNRNYGIKEGVFFARDEKFDVKNNHRIKHGNIEHWNPKHYATIERIKKYPHEHTSFVGAGDTPDSTIQKYKDLIVQNHEEMKKLNTALENSKVIAEDIQKQLPKIPKGTLFIATDSGGRVFISQDKKKLEESSYNIGTISDRHAKLKVFDASSPSVGKHELGLPMVKGLESFLKNRPDKK